ncbi:hypothetical protein BCR43DRAFT_465846 [Syncephalastrum racemosum]|uniref:Oxidoreductase n=1 Tax=Syncephalastrum racemosum TaxID=13706 RepID=A0A1X2HSV0_SYNRA|nr:hypothetical protein BCR43DRAFT_465846 [Syncephalastrum racemosum]
MPQPIVLITGCTKGGIGYGLCKRFASQGCHVYASARRIEAMVGLEELGCTLLALDITNSASIQAAVEKVISESGCIDILVNNAGTPCFGALLDVDIQVARECVEVNVFGTLAVTRAVAKHMARRGSGKIINVGSCAGYATTPWTGVYSLSKTAVHSMTDALRLELAPLGIQVTLVVPGAIRSNIGDTGEAKIRIPEGSWYASVSKYIIGRAQLSQGPYSTTADDFAQHVVARVLRPRIPLNITYGYYSGMFWLFYYIPHFIKDYYFSRRMGVKQLKPVAQ